MNGMRRLSRFALTCLAVVLIAACANQQQPAQKLLGDLEAAVSSASADAAKYMPDQLQDLQAKLAELKAAYDKQDYAAVIARAPALLATAQGLAADAAAKKDEALQKLNGEWSRLAGTVPDAVTKIEKRIDFLGQKANRKKAAGIDVPGAKALLGDATALWSKAQAAFAAGNLEEAVSAAKDVKAKVDALATSLKLDSKPGA